MRVSKSGIIAFQQGYFIGKAETYCEQIIAGAKLAAVFRCRREYLRRVLGLIKAEGLKFTVLDSREIHVQIWIYKYPFVRSLIEVTSKNTTPTAYSVWATGKLFGYSDAEIGAYLCNQGLVKSVFRLESNLPQCSDNHSCHRGA